MSKIVRTSISKRVRFEVFKRDGFTCSYCGSHPPAIILHVDHINPVANGGLNDTDNLTTACDSCNLGKGPRLLSSVPQSLADKAKDVAEREAQIAGYQAILEGKRKRLEDETWRVAFELFAKPGADDLSVRRDYFGSIKRFIEQLGVEAVLNFAELSSEKSLPERNRFLFFCACCWREIKGEHGHG